MVREGDDTAVPSNATTSELMNTREKLELGLLTEPSLSRLFQSVIVFGIKYLRTVHA